MLPNTAMMAKTKFDPKPIEDEKPTNYPKPMLLTTAMMAKPFELKPGHIIWARQIW